MVKPWNQYKDDITHLYIHERRTLKEVREIMSQKHGFNASIRSYRQRFDQWDLQKYKCKRRTARRQQQGQQPPHDRRQSSGSASPPWPSPPQTPPTYTQHEGPPPHLSFPTSAYYSPRLEAFDGFHNVDERRAVHLERYAGCRNDQEAPTLTTFAHRFDDLPQAYTSTDYGFFPDIQSNQGVLGRPF
ncbi:Clr5 domain-containing protein [Emericellopsis atlantica]|uniref:Clr5 domain-containing protein n=1 Tax=Emericellopsis atlantica TaxID=2614577 RepID=A0A9P7ZM66_9HYPO|nr:Clr5 domain-containing protein [Emericellopsis atlantica]KAG9254693.1 Clr5 domain-containing protein [Emericellopsis atlantica]